MTPKPPNPPWAAMPARCCTVHGRGVSSGRLADQAGDPVTVGVYGCSRRAGSLAPRKP